MPLATDQQSPVTDAITEEVRLRQPRARVWRALANADEFALWFGAGVAGQTFAPGAHIRAWMSNPGYEHWPFEIVIDEMTPEERFVWRWHPLPDPAAGVDYADEPMTRVEFTLHDTADGGTLLRVVESGFDAVPASRRERAFRGNKGGWTAQLTKRIPAYLERAG